MNENEYSNKIAQYLDQIRELEAQGRQHGTTNMQCTTDDLKKLIKDRKIPKDLGNWYLKWIDEQNRKYKEWKKFIDDNPNMPEKDRLPHFYGAKTLSPDEMIKQYEDMVNLGKIHNLLLAVNENINGTPVLPVKLFKAITDPNQFGISIFITKAMYYLVDLFKLLEKTASHSNTWIAKGSTQDSFGLTISLEYEFQASNREDAEKKLEDYKQLMKTKGVKTWMAYWAVANEHPSPEFTCKFTDILKCMSNKNRSTRFESDEKQRCWETTKILKKTVFKIEKIIRHNKSGDPVTKWIEQPLVEILGGEIEEKEKYPLKVSVKLLASGINSKDFAPANYNKNTLLLNPNDVLLAYMLQTRAAQLRNSEIHPKFDHESLFKLGNVEQTAISNRREARSKIKRKMATYKKIGIIEDYTEEKSVIRVTRKLKKIKEECVG